MSEKGWISIHRKIQSHWLWGEKPFDKRSAWIDLILMASHKDNKFVLGNELIEVSRGSFVTSEVKLSEKWGWSRTKVRSFLDLLEKDNMLVRKSDSKKTTLTIVNYNDYQFQETTEEHQKNNEKTSEEQRKDTINNENNDNKDIYILTKEEEQFLKTLSEIENYPLDRKKDLEMYKTLEERYPTLNLVEAIEQWRIYKLDKPLKERSNPRSQINTAFKKYVEWGKCIKGENKDARATKDVGKENEGEDWAARAGVISL